MNYADTTDQKEPVVKNKFVTSAVIPSASRPLHLPGEIRRNDARIARIRSLRGKYAYIETSSEAFALRKREELRAED